MNNLNKFTKAELISKFKGLENKNSNPSIFTKIFSYILLFKNLILKITLITFLIKWIKNYSIIRKIWHVISTIASTLLGISFIDIYGFDLIAWIRESQIYQWFSELIVTPKVIEKKSAGESIPSNMKETYPNATRSESDHEIIKRFKEIIYKESEPIVEDELNQENTAFYKNKYFIIGALTISVLVSWYYLDEIKTGYGSVIDWLNSFRRGSSGGTSGIDTNESTTPIAKNIKSELNRLFPENPPKDIELIDNTQTIASSSKGKSVLTSPSLEDLNQRAEDSWCESSSPKSEDSSSTITPANFIESNVIENLWKLLLPDEDKIKINFIEKTFDSTNELDKITGNKLVETLADLFNAYNTQVRFFKTTKIELEDSNKMKEGLYHFRKWISTYHEKILPKEEPITIGNVNDIPNELI